MRLFKTRTLAATAVKGGKIKWNDQPTKPSKELIVGDVISFKTGMITRTVRVIDFPTSRVGAALVIKYMEDLTPQEEYEKLKVAKEVIPSVFFTGKGRPTKRDRRKLGGYL